LAAVSPRNIWFLAEAMESKAPWYNININLSGSAALKLDSRPTFEYAFIPTAAFMMNS
jgi:hypothetical protein